MYHLRNVERSSVNVQHKWMTLGEGVPSRSYTYERVARNESTVTSALYTFIIARCSTKSCSTTRSFVNDTHPADSCSQFYKNISFSSSQQPRRASASHDPRELLITLLFNKTPSHSRRASVKSSLTLLT